MKNEKTLRNVKTGAERTIIRKPSLPTPKPVNVRRVANVFRGKKA
jgi:hypothetical protein